MRIWDLEAIAAHCGVEKVTCNQWRARGRLPKPAGTVSGRPYWRRSVIQDWAREHGYPRGPELVITLYEPTG